MLEAMKQTNAAQGRLAKVIDPELANDVMDEAKEHSVAHQEVSDALARNIHGSMMDEDDLAGDLDAFMAQGSSNNTATSDVQGLRARDPYVAPGSQQRRVFEDNARAEEEAMAELLARSAKPPVSGSASKTTSQSRMK
jgi:hypothetical protein